MLNSVKKFTLCSTEKINILTLVLSEKFFLNETKNHNPPLQVKWSVPMYAALRNKSKKWLAQSHYNVSRVD
jgi:hypothetical protein